LIEKCDTIGGMIRVWMVDMGGVLARHNDKEMEREILHFLGDDTHRSFAEINPLLSGGLLDRMSSMEIDEISFWREFSNLSGLAVPDLNGESLWGKFFHPAIDPIVLDCVKRVKRTGVRVVLASNTEPAHVGIHRMRGDYDVFDAAYTSCLLRCVKPDVRFFEEIMVREASQPGEMFFTDDSQRNCDSAASLGIGTYRFTDALSLEGKLTKMGMLDAVQDRRFVTVSDVER